MFWANILHFYQPYGQKREIIDAIVEQCYRPVGEGILAHPEARLTINFTGVLLDQLAEYGHQEVIDLYAEAARRGQVEFVTSAKYHSILPLLPESEARRQIEINDETNRKYLGDAYTRRGIFLPEMAWAPELTRVLEQVGLEWVALDELAYNGRVGEVDYTKLYQIKGTKLKAFFREHRLSATIMSAGPRDVGRLKEAAHDELRDHRYVVTGMDGETFGHHRISHEQLLIAMFKDPEIELARISDLETKFKQVETVKTVACTWASSSHDIEQGVAFISWRDPDNQIHELQWELLNLAVEELEKLPHDDEHYKRLRAELDIAVASDQFFWAAAKPWWMIEHIERGAHGLLQVLQHLPNASLGLADRALYLYHEIMDLAFDWQRTGKIDEMGKKRERLVRVPFKDATRDNPAAWKAFLHLMREEETAAAERQDYELAILWRDGIYKLEHRLDIYDSMYVIDLLNKRLPKGKIEEMVKRYKTEFDHIRGGQVEQRSN